MKMEFLKDVAEIKPCIVTTPKNKDNRNELYWLTAANLLNDNTISPAEIDTKYQRDEKLKINNNDILIKRINPQYVNLMQNIECEVFASNNLYIVRAIHIKSSYLAFVLDRCIKQKSERLSVGAVIPSLSRQDLENIEIPIVSIDQQEKLGKFWICSIEKKKLQSKLLELEYLKETQLLTNYIMRGNEENETYNI